MYRLTVDHGGLAVGRAEGEADDITESSTSAVTESTQIAYGQVCQRQSPCVSSHFLAFDYPKKSSGVEHQRLQERNEKTVRVTDLMSSLFVQVLGGTCINTGRVPGHYVVAVRACFVIAT